MIIGITGGTGCGKTSLLELIRKRGGIVLDCDAIYHELLRTDRGMLLDIGDRFPGVIENGSLNRKKLGAIVFGDDGSLQALNDITHGAVKREVVRRLESKPALAAIDAIGLFEGRLAELCDVTVAVTAPLEDRVRRLVARDKISESYARARIAAQKTPEWYKEKCHVTLDNNGTIEAFEAKCLAFLQGYAIMEENL